MVRETTPDDIRHVCANLRAVDAEEQFATRFPGDDTADALARDMIARMPRALLSYCFHEVDETPGCILSAYLTSPGVARLHRIGTKGSERGHYEVFSFGIRQFIPALKAAGIHRAECSILAKHDQAADILQRLGFEFQISAVARGRNREDFIDFAWVKRDV